MSIDGRLLLSIDGRLLLSIDGSMRLFVDVGVGSLLLSVVTGGTGTGTGTGDPLSLSVDVLFDAIGRSSCDSLQMLVKKVDRGGRGRIGTPETDAGLADGSTTPGVNNAGFW